MKPKFVFLALFYVLLLLSCNTNDAEKKQEVENMSENISKKETDSSVNSDLSDTTKFKLDLAIANFPTPSQIIKELSNLNLSYNNSILLDPKKFNSITENYKKCLVLGIYNADVFYVLNYNQGSDVLNYYKSIYQLSKNIGIEGIMNEGLKQRMDKNLSNKDSLTKIMEDIYIQSDSYLKNNKRLYDFTLIITGAWLEGVYLNCKLSKGAPDNRVKDLSYKHVWEQRFHLGNLINVLKDFSAQNKEIEPILNNLISLHNKINSIPDYKKMDSKLFEDISSEIFKVREFIIN